MHSWWWNVGLGQICKSICRVWFKSRNRFHFTVFYYVSRLSSCYVYWWLFCFPSFSAKAAKDGLDSDRQVPLFVIDVNNFSNLETTICVLTFTFFQCSCAVSIWFKQDSAGFLNFMFGSNWDVQRINTSRQYKKFTGHPSEFWICLNMTCARCCIWHPLCWRHQCYSPELEGEASTSSAICQTYSRLFGDFGS